MTRIIQMAPGVFFAAAVLDPDWNVTASGVARPTNATSRTLPIKAKSEPSPMSSKTVDIDGQFDLT